MEIKPLRFTAPGGWAVTPQHDANEFPGLLTGFQRGTVEIVAAAFSAADVPAGKTDSRRLALIAERLAATWSVPLLDWTLPVPAMIQESYRRGKTHARYVASGTAGHPRIEVALTARLPDEHRVPEVRNAIAQMIASLELSDREHPFAHLPFPPKLRPGKVRLSATRWESSEGALTLPPGWIPYDMVVVLASEFIPHTSRASLTLARRPPDDGLLRLMWSRRERDAAQYERHAQSIRAWHVLGHTFAMGKLYESARGARRYWGFLSSRLALIATSTVDPGVIRPLIERAIVDLQK